MLTPYADALSHVWTCGNLKKGVKAMIESSLLNGLKIAGFDTFNIKRVIDVMIGVSGKSSKYTLHKVIHDLTGFDYQSFNNIIYDEAVNKKTLNLNFFTSSIIDQLKKITVLPYSVISLYGKLLNAVTAPLASIITNKNFLKNCKEVSDSIPTTTTDPTLLLIKSCFAEISTGSVILKNYLSFLDPPEPQPGQISSNFTEIYDRMAVLGRPGGFKKYIETTFGDTNATGVILSFINFFSGNYFDTETVDGFIDTISSSIVPLLLVANRYKNDPSIILLQEGVAIPIDLTITRIIDIYNTSGIIGITSEQLLEDLRFIINKIFDVISVFEAMIKPIYKIAEPVLTIARTIVNAFTAKGATVGSGADACFRDGKALLEYSNQLITTAVNKLPTTLIDMSGMLTAFLAESGVDMSNAPDDSAELVEFVRNQLGDNFLKLPNVLLKSLKGSFFGNTLTVKEGIEITTKGSQFGYGKVVEFARQLVYLLYNKDYFSDMKARIDGVAVPVCSAEGKFTTFAKEILMSDILTYLTNYAELMVLMSSNSSVDVSSYQTAFTTLAADAQSAENAEKQYREALSPLSKVWIYVAVAVAGVTVICAIIAFIVIRKRKNEKKSEFARL